MAKKIKDAEEMAPETTPVEEVVRKLPKPPRAPRTPPKTKHPTALPTRAKRSWRRPRIATCVWPPNTTTSASVP